MSDRVILHCDINNFFASVEMLNNPDLRGKAVAVCGDPSRRSGIVLAKSEAAKKYGVKTGMVIWEAKRLCPEIIIIATNHSDYSHYSHIVRDVYYRYTDKVEAMGGDECWLDVTNSLKMLKLTGPELADEIRRVIASEIGLTISVGVSWNKIYAKLGSDLKKPDATTVITRDNYKDIIYPLPVMDMLYIGRKTARLLEKINVRTIGDLAGFDPKLLAGHIGVNAHRMIEMARGECTEEVKDFHHKRVIKSVGNGTTTPYDLTTRREIEQVLYLLSEEVAYRMRRKGVKGHTVSLSIRDAELKWTSSQISLAAVTNASQTIAGAAMKVFDRLWKLPDPVHSMRVAVSNLTTDKRVQLSLLDKNNEDFNDKVSAVFDKIRCKYGTTSVMFAGNMGSDFKLEFEVHDE